MISLSHFTWYNSRPAYHLDLCNNTRHHLAKLYFANASTPAFSQCRCVRSWWSTQLFFKDAICIAPTLTLLMYISLTISCTPRLAFRLYRRHLQGVGKVAAFIGAVETCLGNLRKSSERNRSRRPLSVSSVALLTILKLQMG